MSKVVKDDMIKSVIWIKGQRIESTPANMKELDSLMNDLDEQYFECFRCIYVRINNKWKKFMIGFPKKWLFWLLI